MKISTLTLIASALFSSSGYAAYEFELGDNNTLKFGGYLKADIRHVDGNVPYRPFWIATGTTGEDASQTHFNMRESRFNASYTHGKVMGFVEVDFYGSDGSEAVVNNYDPRLRHAFIKYDNWLVGQTWSTFMPLKAIPETLDFGGPHVGEAFIRQTQIRYTYGGFQFALENPETTGADNKNDSLPDVVGRYIHKADWGELAVAALVRQLDSDGLDKTVAAFNLSGKLLIGEKDDFRFQVNVGKPGRYVAPGLTTDVITHDDQPAAEETTAYTAAYRHFWSESYRSTVFYGHAKTDIQNRERQMWGVNLIKQLTPYLWAGVEVGNYEVSDANADSTYLQFSVKYTL
ncbi:porin [Shewanella corallii]|uniref:Porin n=1 Tax=Shewanella corallii TaxID=560080 RepID=A0ABT0N3R6_9GAMM|nr:DcaP family trimeric outer membrane transporter [Shewanella corallii]MCL2913067.1 porin [Shewanella corallii]